MRSPGKKRLDRAPRAYWAGLVQPLVFMSSIGLVSAPAYSNSGACYNFTSIDSPNAPIGRTFLRGLNNQGTYFGYAPLQAGNADVLPFFYSASGFAFPPNAYNSPYANYNGINDSATAVGNLNESCNQTSDGIFLYQAGVLSQPSLSFPDGLSACPTAVGIDNSGAIAGNVLNSALTQSWGFLSLNGSTTIIDVPNSRPGSTSLQAISSNEMLLGQYFTTGNTQQYFLYSNGHFSNVSLPSPYAYGLNSSGTIAGWFDSPAGLEGFVDNAGDYEIIDYPGTTGATIVNGINDSNVIVGAYTTDHGNTYHGFIGNPIAISPNDPLPEAVDEAAATPMNTPIQLDLGAGADGACLSTTIVGTPVGGTIIGPPSTSVQFNPTAGFTGPASFKFFLSGPTGSSNVAIATIAVLGTAPAYLPQTTKTELLLLSSAADHIADALEGASIGTEAGTKPSALAKKIAIYVAQSVLTQLLAANDQGSIHGLDYMASAVQFSTTGLDGLEKINATSVGYDAAALVFRLISLGATALAIDPPDSHYKKIFVPQTYSFPPTGNAAVDSAITDYLNYESLLAAALHSGERWQGATLAGNSVWETRQLQAFNTYFQQASQAKATVQTDDQSLASTLPPVSLANFPGGVAAIAAAFNAQCGEPLPGNLNKQILSLGVSQTTIDQSVCTFVQGITPAGINSDFSSELTPELP